VLVGYAAVYESRSLLINNKFVEIIKRNAFEESLRSHLHDVRALVEHDPIKILGRRSAGTLKVEDDVNGVRVEISMPDTTYSKDLMESVKRGDIRGMSFGFKCEDDSWEMDNDTPVRSVKKASLVEVSPTGFPMYTDTEVAVRSCAKFVQQLVAHEEAIRARRLRLLEASLFDVQQRMG